MAVLGTIYRYSRENGKGYTGWTTNLEKRKRQHEQKNGNAPIFYDAITKYGIGNFRFEILEENVPIEREKYWIAHFDDFHNGYNGTIGGNGTGSGENNPRFGMKSRPETCQKISNALKGRERSAEHCLRISESKQGTKHTAETKRKMSETRAGKNNPNYGNGHKVAGEKNLSARPDYTEMKREFVLCLPLFDNMLEVRKYLSEKFSQVHRATIWRRVRKWQLEME